MHLGLIGFGRLGRLLTRYLAQDFEVHVFDTQPDPQAVRALGAIPASLAEACAQPLVLPLVPISAFEELMREIAPLLSDEALVIDACSVKSLPVEWMCQHLPPRVSLLGSHPMFGPDSAGDTLFGTKLVLCPVRIAPERYQPIVRYLEKHGIKVIETTPAEHDRQISRSLFLAHLLGRTLLEFGASPLPIDTKGYRRLMKILLTVENDSVQLFEDMYRFNPFAPDTRREFMAALAQVNARLES